jgi:hypothetical protein
MLVLSGARGIRRAPVRISGFSTFTSEAFTPGSRQITDAWRSHGGMIGERPGEGLNRHEIGALMEARTQELRSETWVEYFDGITLGEHASFVTVEVVRDRPGDQQDRARRLRTIGYNPDHDLLHLAVAGHRSGDAIVLRHFISGPRTIKADGADLLSPAAILVDDASGTRTRIRFFDRPSASACDEVRGTRRQAPRSQRRSRCLTNRRWE